MRHSRSSVLNLIRQSAKSWAYFWFRLSFLGIRILRENLTQPFPRRRYLGMLGLHSTFIAVLDRVIFGIGNGDTYVPKNKRLPFRSHSSMVCPFSDCSICYYLGTNLRLISVNVTAWEQVYKFQVRIFPPL